MKYLLAIDQSTSGTKAILFDARGRVLDQASLPHRQIYPRPGWVEHNATKIFGNVLGVLITIIERNRSKIRHLAGISITNQRETIVAFDRQTGEPLHHALVWQDRRGDALCAKLTKQGYNKLVRQKTGLKIDTYFSASKIRWLIENNREIATRLRNGTAVIGTIDTFLISRLTFGKTFATDYTNASRTLLFDVRKLHWDPQLCKLFRVPLNALPAVRESASHFGTTDVHGILKKPVPIVGVMGDSQASLFAQRCFKPGTAKATFGTGTSVLLNIGHNFRASSRGSVTALAWVHRGRPTYALEGLINFSAATIEWLKNQLQLVSDAAKVEALATHVPDNGGVYLVPAFAGLSAPYWSPHARAAIIGMTAHTRKEHLIRAALESIAYQIRDVLDMMRTDAKISLKALHADGGPTRNRFLMQFTADQTRTKIAVAEVAESSAWGAAMNGLLALGLAKSLNHLKRLPHKQKIYKPATKPAQADKLHAAWLTAVRRVL